MHREASVCFEDQDGLRRCEQSTEAFHDKQHLTSADAGPMGRKHGLDVTGMQCHS